MCARTHKVETAFVVLQNVGLGELSGIGFVQRPLILHIRFGALQSFSHCLPRGALFQIALELFQKCKFLRCPWWCRFTMVR